MDALYTSGITGVELLAFYGIVAASLVYLLFKYGKDPLFLLITLCFYSGLAAYLGKVVENPYKIILVLLSVYLALKYLVFNPINRRYALLIASFALFTGSFFLSAYINKDYFNLTFSQYGKYITPFLILLILLSFSEHEPDRIEEIGGLLFTLISIQILLSVTKVLIIGPREWIVGSISFVGGGPATSLAILGFIILWLRAGRLLRRKDWLYLVLLLVIGFASSKRAIWFVMPVVIFTFMAYVPHKITLGRAPLILGLAALVFYIGVRVSPTLNSDHRVWGPFNLDYVVNYASDYTFGSGLGQNLGDGRGGATLLLYDRLQKMGRWTQSDILGSGLNKIYTKDYEQFSAEDFAINSKGAATGMFQSFITAGYLGIIATLVYLIGVLICVDERRIRYALMALVLWDYILYSGQILRTQSLAILFFYIIVASVQTQTGRLATPEQVVTDGSNGEPT